MSYVSSQMPHKVC